MQKIEATGEVTVYGFVNAKGELIVSKTSIPNDFNAAWEDAVRSRLAENAALKRENEEQREAWDCARNELDASLYALSVVQEELEKNVPGPDWKEVIAGFDRVRLLMDDAFVPSVKATR